MDRKDLFINGEMVAPSGRDVLEVVSPHTEEVIATAPVAAPGDVDRAVAAARRAFDDGPWPRLDPATDLGPLVTRAQQQRVWRYVDEGVYHGARLVAGGTGLPDDVDRGWYVKPTLFADVENDASIAQEEIFGPVLTVIPYDTEADAIRLANNSIYGLAGAVWTADPARGLRIAEHVHAGTFGVNQGYSMDPAAPFGGVKASGYGRELGPESLDTYLDTKSISIAQ